MEILSRLSLCMTIMYYIWCTCKPMHSVKPLEGYSQSLVMQNSTGPTSILENHHLSLAQLTNSKENRFLPKGLVKPMSSTGIPSRQVIIMILLISGMGEPGTKPRVPLGYL